jgi:hypothetical protein
VGEKIELVFGRVSLRRRHFDVNVVSIPSDECYTGAVVKNVKEQGKGGCEEVCCV